MEMDMNEALFMNGGEGDASYAQNSRIAQKMASLSKPVLENTVQSLFLKDFHLHKAINVADLGCSGGPTPISVISTVKMGVMKKCKELNCAVPELQFYLNDLPGNDFNSLFKRVSTICTQNEGSLCFVMGAPGSFYGRLFPRESLHLVHASYSLHFLSLAPLGLASKEGMPLNKGKIYISKTSPPVVREAYLAQFKHDFTLFLECRAKEMVKDGHLMLTLQGRLSSNPTSKESCYQWELLADAIAAMVSEGLVDEEKLDSFNVPYYTPTIEELQDVVESEGSFTVELLKSFTIDASDENENDIQAKGKKVCYNIRCISESMISYHFGEEVVEQVYDKLTQLVVEVLAKESTKLTSIIAVLRRNIQAR